MKTFKIFLADDDKDDLYLFKEALYAEMNEHQVHLEIFVNGIQLLGRLKEPGLLPDMIFLDINMPQKNGLECLKEIRKNPLYNDVKIIMHSTASEVSIIDMAYKMGADLYIVKADSFETIQKNIRKCLFYDWDTNEF